MRNGRILNRALAALIGFGPTAANAAPLTLNGVRAGSTMADVRRQFPTAKSDRLCKGETARYADGVSRCEYLKVPEYRLAGYDLRLNFWFSDDGTLKTVSLNWPHTFDGTESPTAQEIENAYSALLDLLVSKYGRYVRRPPCSYIGGHCQEWQMDGSLDWHAGGERIELKYDTKILPGVSLTYTFADTQSFDRF